MSKRGGFPGGMGGFGGMNLNNLMKEAKKMQADMEKSQAELATKEFEATAGGGAITVKVSGEKTIKEIKIKPEVVDRRRCRNARRLNPNMRKRSLKKSRQ